MRLKLEQGKSAAQLRLEREKRVTDTIQLKMVDRVPIICPMGYFPGKAAGISFSAAYYDYKAWYNAYKTVLPDYPADIEAHKGNLLVRIGTLRGGLLYAAVSLLGCVLFFVSLSHGVRHVAGVYFIPAAVLSLYNSFLVVTKRYQSAIILERICALTISVNLLTTAAYFAGF